MTPPSYHLNQTVDNSSGPLFRTLFDLLPPCFHHRAFPCHCLTKTPAVRRWERDRRTPIGRRRLLTGYQLRFPDHALGLRLGEGVDGPLAVIDVDAPEDLTDWQMGQLEAWTWTVATARGWHCYGRPPEWALQSVKRLPWGDYLGNKSFVVAPGNQHKSGATYRALPGWGEGDVPDFPETLLHDLLLPRTAQGDRSHQEPSQYPKRTEGWKDQEHDEQEHDAKDGKPFLQAPPHYQGNDVVNRTPPRTMADRLAEMLWSAQSGERDETLFLALRHWSYRQPQPETLEHWILEVQGRAYELVGRIRNRTDYPDGKALDMGRRVAEWTWQKHFRRPEADSQEKRMLQLVGAENRRAKNHARNEAILSLHAAGFSLRQIAAHVGLGRSAVGDLLKRGTAEIAAKPEELARALQQ